MARRIQSHRSRRPAAWQTVEAPLALPEAVAGAEEGRLLLVDCLTLWLGNLLLHDPASIPSRRAALCRAVAAREEPIILVSSEVGAGIVPDHPAGRAFRDAQGELNQEVAALCDRVELIVAGLPLRLV